ncbi:MAG TPA: amino acid permease [Chitinophagaceae bacterium]|nr:amino acid permease [Chitinophagaceae bacterium]
MNQLQRKIGLWTAVSIVAGSVIGSGIFMKPALMASQLGSPGVLLLVWVVAGILSLFGALIMAEVATLLPETGGQFVFIKEMYSDFMAYLLGWAAFIVINTGGVAAIAFIFSKYFEFFFPLPRFSPEMEQSLVLHIPFIGNILPLEDFGVKSLTILLIVFLSYINYRSVSSSNSLQVIFTFAKVAALIFLVVAIFCSGKGDPGNFIQPSSNFSLSGFPLAVGFIAATSGAFAAYDGWGNLASVAGEIINPAKNIARSFIIGMFLCMGVYLLVNVAYLFVMNVDTMAGSKLVAANALQISVGGIAAGLISAMIMISCFGASNVNVMACPRITFTMARNGYFFNWAGKVHPRFQTPGNAIWLHAAWSSLLVISGSFDMLTDMFVFVSWLFYGIIAVGLFILRRKMKDKPRTYKVWGYPIVPAVFIMFTAFFLCLTVYNDVKNYVEGKTPIINSLLGLGLTLAGIPLYFYFKRRRRELIEN